MSRPEALRPSAEALRPSAEALRPSAETLRRGAAASGPLLPVIVALALGLWRAGEKSLWLDEAVSVAIARLPTLEMLAYLWRNELHGAPYYILLHPWLGLGEGEAAVRALSIVFGVVAVLATYAIGRRYGVGLPAALLLAVLPTFVQFEQEARGYSMLMAASAVGTLLFLRLVERPSLARAAPYVFVAAGIVYVQPLGALVVAAHGLALLLGPAAARRRLLAVFVPVALAWLPMLRFVLLNRDRIDWIPPTTPQLLFDHLVALGGGLATALLLLVLVVFGMRRDALTLWLLVPILGTIAISLLLQPTLQSRYLVSVLPAAAVIAARNRPALVALLLAVALVGTWSWYEHGQKEDWRQVAAWVASEARPDDGIVFAPAYLRSAFGYYARVGDPLYPPAPWSESDLVRQPPDLAAFAASERVWLVEAHGRELPDELRATLAGLVPAETREYPPHGLRATLLVPGGASP